MGLSLRCFIAVGQGAVVRVPLARWSRAHHGEPLDEYAGQQLKVFDVVCEVQGRTLERVLRIVPYRVTVDASGRLNTTALMAMALRRLPSFPPTDDDAMRAIDRLEADANYFWEPDDAQWTALASRLGVAVSVVKSARFSSTGETA